MLVRLRTPGRFVNGGDRRSHAWRNRHAAVVVFVERQLETKDPAEVVVEAVVNDAANRFHSKGANPEALRTFIRKVTTVVLRRHRREVDSSGAERELTEVCETFKEEIIEVGPNARASDVEPAVSTNGTSLFHDQGGPFVSNVTLDDLKSVDGTILTQWVGLHTEMFMTQRAIEKRKETEAESVKEQKIAESVKEQKIAEYTTRQREAECATRQKEIDLEIAKEVTRQKEIEGGGRVGLSSTQQKRKRDSEDEHDGQWLNNECRTSWRRMCSLSAEVWDHRPDHHPESLSDFLLRFDRWAKVGDNLRGTRHRIRFIAKGPGIFVVYYDPSIQIPLCHHTRICFQSGGPHHQRLLARRCRRSIRIKQCVCRTSGIERTVCPKTVCEHRYPRRSYLSERIGSFQNHDYSHTERTTW